MSRPVVVYLVMIITLIAGLSLVLEIGSYLSTPEDLAGKWQIQTTAGDWGPGLNIEQSGKFFQLAFEHGPQLDLKLQSTSPTLLTNNSWKLTIAGRDGSDDKTLQLSGPRSAHWTAHRTSRTFPQDPTTREAR